MEKIKGINPFLPSYEYIPDAEPRVFNNRVYIYGSHDRFNGISFCINDYITYSAPIDDLTNWRYEGVIYKRKQDPKPGFGPLGAMFASDVIKGNDGKYYMYYGISFSSRISVSVSNSPAGPYNFLDFVRYSDGRLYGSKKDPFQFDPGIFIDDNKKIYLYTGFSPKSFLLLSLKGKRVSKKGAMVVELEQDMKTIKTPIKYITKTIHNSQGTEFEGHEFFEAPSLRKIEDKYYFIYSSINGHELCYAVSDYPDRDFKYGGVLVSIADIGLSNKPLNYTGNTHGSLLELNGNYYIFYHRQTNRNSFSRQACAESIKFKNGKFYQAEVTSQGLRNKPLPDIGLYDAYIACNLYSKDGIFFHGGIKNKSKVHPYFTQFGKDREDNPNQHIANFNKKAVAGFKYFEFKDSQEIAVLIKGRASGMIKVSHSEDGKIIGEIKVNPTKEFTWFKSNFKPLKGKQALFFQFEGKGSFRFMSFELS